MRSFAGIFAFCLPLLFGVDAFAQVKGEVESVGFNGYFRPGCWTPVLVRLQATSGAPFKGQIVVKQDDMDGDHVSYAEPFSMGGNVEGGSSEAQRYWTYFLPKATLATDAQGLSGAALNQQLPVFIFDESGTKELLQLTHTSSISSVDNSSRTGFSRSSRLILFVVGSSTDHPSMTGFQPNGSAAALGIAEDVQPVEVSIGSVKSSLPENVIGYEAVDAIVWCNADFNKCTDKQRQALRSYVDRGGRLVIVQSGEPSMWATQAMSLGDLMPVTVKDVGELRNLNKLKEIQKLSMERTWAKHRDQGKAAREERLAAWDLIPPPFKIGLAEPKAGASVDEWLGDVSYKEPVPFIVRQPYGLGTVTWVALDLCNTNLRPQARGMAPALLYGAENWAYIWDRVFDWASNTITPTLRADKDLNSREVLDPFQANSIGTNLVRLDYAMLKGMELQGKGTALVGLAVLFFIVYWVAGGPGSHLILRARRRTTLNWFVFTAVALAATLLTVGIVKLVVSGPPQLHHVSFVRVDKDGKGWVRSRFGLYIPQDGMQSIALKNTDPAQLSYVSPFPPADNRSLTTFSAHQDYQIPVIRQSPEADPKADVFYRRTLKKLQACWSGQLLTSNQPDAKQAVPMVIEGEAKLKKDANNKGGGGISGRLTNKTGRDLQNVYFVFNRPTAREMDQIVYLPRWDKDGTIDLAQVVDSARGLGAVGRVDPSGTIGTMGFLSHDAITSSHWDEFFLGAFRGGSYETQVDDTGDPLPRSFVMLSLFDRLPVMKEEKNSRQDLGRWGLRYLDASGAVSAGELLVLAQSSGPLPMPVEVQGRHVDGEGMTFYQFVLPLDRSAAPATKPVMATQPATTRAATMSVGPGLPGH